MNGLDKGCESGTEIGECRFVFDGLGFVKIHSEMPTNALALPMPCDILDGCTLRNPCQSRTSQDSSNEPQPSTSHWDNQLCFVTNEFFEEAVKLRSLRRQILQEYRKDADLKYDFYIEEYTIQSEVYMESEPFDNQKGGSLKWRLRIYPRR
ncbi:unnamed protein product [Anisakis simplex]|uniref:MATH domain-containing protein n=2 Tax=Anisakis simplex TaxID=6269 RepID=A0A0M3JE24_ANISI|nr:unnamed protein product [Anisakis simplex]